MRPFRATRSGAILLLCFFLTAPSFATIYYVATNGADSGNECTNPATPSKTITNALGQASGGDMISIGTGTFTEAGITVSVSVAVMGQGASNTIIQAWRTINSTNRVFHILGGVTSSIESLTIQHGKAPTITTNSPGGCGGGILNEGFLTLKNCIIWKNRAGQGGVGRNLGIGGAVGGQGGGIWNSGTLQILGCEILTNRAGNGGAGYHPYSGTGAPGGPGGGGGGIYNGGTLLASNCSVRQNVAGTGGNASTMGAMRGGDGGPGGGICSTGKSFLTRCLITSNLTGNGGSGASGQSYVSGSSGGHGGGFYNAGTANVDQCIISQNMTGNGLQGVSAGGGPGGSGGGLYNHGALIMSNSTFSANGCGIGGLSGAVQASAGSGGSGGGIGSDGYLSIVNCTLSSNRAGNAGFGDGNRGGDGGDGGGLFIGQVVTSATVVYDSTIVWNYTGNGSTGGLSSGHGGNGGGVSCGSTNWTAKNVLLAHNLAATNSEWNNGVGNDCWGTFTGEGYNLILDTNYWVCVGTTNGNVLEQDPFLGPLQDNGGFTVTHALLPGSPAIDAGDPDFSPPPDMDQRGVPRVENGRIDIGAFEAIPPSLDTDTDDLPDWWEWQYSESITAMLASADADYDNMNNVDERIVGCDPTDSNSIFVAEAPGFDTNGGYILTWPSTSDRVYAVHYNTDLVTEPAFSDLATNLASTPPVNTYTDTTHSAEQSGFYRVGVRLSP